MELPSVPDTIRSRCLEFKLNLNLDEIKEIVNQYFDENIYEKISSDFANNYSSPCFLINLINYIKHTNNEISTFLIEDLIYEVIENKHYINNNFIKK